MLTHESGTGPSNVVDIFDSNSGAWATAQLAAPRQFFAGTSLPLQGLAFFAGGDTGSTFTDLVDIYNGITGVWTIAQLSVGRRELAATSMVEHGIALFAGGITDSHTPSNVVDIYNAITGVWTTAHLTEARYNLAATSLAGQGLAIFAGGHDKRSASNVVDMYNFRTEACTAAQLSDASNVLAATSLAEKGLALFAGGWTGLEASNIVTIYSHPANMVYGNDGCYLIPGYSTALPAGIVAAIVVSVLLADIVFAYLFFKSNRLNVADSKGWILTSLILGPLAWPLWWLMGLFDRCKQRGLGKTIISEPLLAGDTP